MDRKSLFVNLTIFIQAIEQEFDEIPYERRQRLQELAIYIQSGLDRNEAVKLIFICTHNSRRSHMAQIWAQTAAYYYDIPGVFTFSGGTEATAFNTRAVNAMKEAGFVIRKIQEGQNPIYRIIFSESAPAQDIFSKRYEETPNPSEGFAAILTCSDADHACPVIVGADARFSIKYQDPKEHDGTDHESEAYSERCRQIAREMFYIFSIIGKKQS